MLNPAESCFPGKIFADAALSKCCGIKAFMPFSILCLFILNQKTYEPLKTNGRLHEAGRFLAR